MRAKHTRKYLAPFLVSIGIIIFCFLIVILRLFHPHHRLVAVLLYIVSWIVYIYPLVNKAERDNIRKSKEMKFLHKHKLSIIATIFSLLVVYLLYVAFPLNDFSLARMDSADLEAMVNYDSRYLLEVIDSANQAYQDLTASNLSELSLETSDYQRNQIIREKLSRLYEHLVILDSYVYKYKYFYQINRFTRSDMHDQTFLIAYTSLIIRYKIVLDLSREIKDNAYAQTILDESTEGNLQDDIFSELRSHLTDPDEIIQINMGRAYLEFVSQNQNLSMDASILLNISQSYYRQLNIDAAQSISLGADALLKGFEKSAMKSWLPIQTNIANFMGDTRLNSRHENFITIDQIREIKNQMQPGDIFFQRKNWYISNIGMPGFWTHAGIYTGSLKDLDNYFRDESMILWNITVSEYLHTNFPDIHAKLISSMGGYEYVTIEGKKEGVVILPFEVPERADYMAVVRPKLTKVDKLKSIVSAYNYYGKPYDYDFDFSTDGTLVCSELVYKAYLRGQDKDGLEFELGTLAGRAMISPNDMVKAYDDNYEYPSQQYEFVLFLDGNEQNQKADYASKEDFRKSWKRPRHALALP